MELTEAVQRILRHGRLILAMVVVFLSLPFLLGAQGDASYVASARAYFGTDATTAEESEAMVDTAKAIVTSQTEIEAALQRERIDRDPTRVVDEIDVESVGGSGVLVVSVTDGDPDVASALANGMAQQLVSSRHDLLIGPMEDRLAELESGLELVNAEIDRITEATGEPGADIDQLRFQLDVALSRQSDIQSQRDTLSQTLDATPSPRLLDQATPPSYPESSGLAADLAVAGLLGLILGVALAAVIEALRPSIVSGDALAHVLGAPLLGRIPNPSSRSAELADSDDDLVSLQLGLAASSARLDVVHLTRVGPDVDLDGLAGRLRTAVPHVAVELVGSERPDAPRPGPRSNRARHGLVVVAPEVLQRDAFSGLEHLLAITQWPLVGIIAYPGPLWTHYHVRDDLRALWTRFRTGLGSKVGRRHTAQSAATPGTWAPSGPEVES